MLFAKVFGNNDSIWRLRKSPMRSNKSVCGSLPDNLIKTKLSVCNVVAFYWVNRTTYEMSLDNYPQFVMGRQELPDSVKDSVSAALW